MIGSIHVTGIVLATIPIGDYDKRLTILTRERGKITAFAKGARKPNSALLACSQPFTYGSFELYQGRNSYNVMSVEVSTYFEGLREDITYVYYGLYFCELAEYITQEGSEGGEMLKLLYLSLKALMHKGIGVKLVRYIYELKLLCINGEAPQVFECVKCGSMEGLSWFFVPEGGILCTECAHHLEGRIPVSPSTLYTFQYILSAELKKLYTFTVTDDVFLEMKRILDAYRDFYIDHHFKSIEMLTLV